MATAIPARLNPRRMTAEFALANRLRTEGLAAEGSVVDDIRARRLPVAAGDQAATPAAR
jgi:hypothetical protein